MSLTKLKKTELVALAEANDLGIDDDWSKADIIAELEEAGISAESENDGEGHAHVSKAERQTRLIARTDRTQ